MVVDIVCDSGKVCVRKYRTGYNRHVKNVRFGVFVSLALYLNKLFRKRKFKCFAIYFAICRQSPTLLTLRFKCEKLVIAKKERKIISLTI